MTFVKGKSGNPLGGRAGALSLVGILRDELKKVNPSTQEPYARELVRAYIREAYEKSDLKRDAFDRIDGKPKQAIEGNIDGNITITIKKL